MSSGKERLKAERNSSSLRQRDWGKKMFPEYTSTPYQLKKKSPLKTLNEVSISNTPLVEDFRKISKLRLSKEKREKINYLLDIE
jgi:hypothetical protein